MKPKTLITLRNESFFNTCKEVTRSISCDMTSKEVVEIALGRSGVDYYVDYDLARKHVGRILRHGILWKYVKVREGIWHEIAFRVSRLMKHYPCLSQDDALSRVLADGKASRYFIGVSSARRIYQRMLKAERDSRAEMNRHCVESEKRA